MVSLSIENPAEQIPRIRALLALNWAETGFDFEFDPDLDAYQRLFDAGLMFAVIARIGGEVVGYCTVCVVTHPHNRRIVVGSNDALFVHPDHRGSTGARLIRAAEQEAAARGANRFTWHCRAGTPLADVLTRHGYTPVDVVVMRELRHGD